MREFAEIGILYIVVGSIAVFAAIFLALMLAPDRSALFLLGGAFGQGTILFASGPARLTAAIHNLD